MVSLHNLKWNAVAKVTSGHLLRPFVDVVLDEVAPLERLLRRVVVRQVDPGTG